MVDMVKISSNFIRLDIDGGWHDFSMSLDSTFCVWSQLHSRSSRLAIKAGPSEVAKDHDLHVGEVLAGEDGSLLTFQGGIQMNPDKQNYRFQNY